jgi:hypothetical protein
MTAVRWPVGIAASVLALAASCGGNDTCADFAGDYSVTTEVVSTANCRVGLHLITQPITWSFVQTARSCSFTMTNTVYPDSVYSGQFTMKGTRASVTWTSVDPVPSAAGKALTYTSEDLTVAPASIISGSFAWSNAGGCSGTTNVCHGSLAAGCPTPN